MRLLKEHTRPAPPWADRLLAEFGSNPYGGPRYRLIWGPSRKEIVGGYWADVARYEYRPIARYTEQAFVLEKWCPPYLYGSPAMWDIQNRDAWGYLSCGPFPHRGDYETVHLFHINDTYQQPVPALVRAIVINVERGNLYSLSDKRIAIKDRMQAQKKAHHQRISDEFDEAMPLHYGPTIGYGGATNTADIDKIRMDRTISDLPANIRKVGKNSFEQV